MVSKVKKINLSTGILSLKNLRAKPVRTACLVMAAAILAFTLFGGSNFALNLRQGLATMTKCFGADVMVVPERAGEKAQSLLLHGGTGYFYFDSGIVDTPQFFLASLSNECCDTAYVMSAGNITLFPQGKDATKPKGGLL
jgi:putative ABC transport system permease protein